MQPTPSSGPHLSLYSFSITCKENECDEVKLTRNLSCYGQSHLTVGGYGHANMMNWTGEVRAAIYREQFRILRDKVKIPIAIHSPRAVLPSASPTPKL